MDRGEAEARGFAGAGFEVEDRVHAVWVPPASEVFSS